MKINFLGIIKNNVRYSVELNGHEFDYFTGLGWLKPEKPVEKNYSDLVKLKLFLT